MAIETLYFTLQELAVWRDAAAANPEAPTRAGDAAVTFLRILLEQRKRLEPGATERDSMIHLANDMGMIHNAMTGEIGVTMTVDTCGENPKRLRLVLTDETMDRQSLSIVDLETRALVRSGLDPTDGVRIAMAINGAFGVVPLPSRKDPRCK